MTRLEKLCKLYKWQGGTIHDASIEMNRVLMSSEYNALYLLDCPNREFSKLIYKYWLIKTGRK
jgi:hypothetical protein